MQQPNKAMKFVLQVGDEQQVVALLYVKTGPLDGWRYYRQIEGLEDATQEEAKAALLNDGFAYWYPEKS